jgi:predicted RNase H-like HicB family nuclease
VRFPDVHNCFTSGADLPEAMEMAEDVLCMMLYELEEAEKAIPAASTVAQAQSQAENGEFVTLIACDTLEYRKLYNNRAVKKTLSIPSWLNDMAERAGVNFSGTLQEALKQQLNI